MVTDHPDGLLVRRLRAGDIDALGELYEKYKARVYRTALAITQDRGAAEDILQESFLRLLTHAHRLRTDVPLQPWLYRVTVNLSYTWAQRQRRQEVETGEGVLEQLVASLHLLPEQWVERKETREAIQRAILRLPLSHRIVVVLFYLEGLELREIAGILGVPEGTVKSRLHYARESLRKLLGERRSASRVVYEFT